MSLRRPVLPKRRAGSKRGPAPLEPVRLAVAALTRLRQALTAAGHGDRVGKPATSVDLAARERLFGGRPPPSYVAAVQLAAGFGDPDVLLDREAMAAAVARIEKERPGDSRRYFPFGRGASEGSLLAFDRDGATPDGECPVVDWSRTAVTPRASSFGQWLDAEADAREEDIATASILPNRLRVLLSDLGFRFDFPLVGRLETGDIAAVEELLGPERTALVRSGFDRLFDSSGRASLSLNLDEFSLAVSVRTGIYVFEAEDVFRWLRYFRDENFFGESTKDPSHPDAVRDLRKAPREAATMRRGVMEVRALPAHKHTFRGAAGLSPDDFYLLGRTREVREDSPSLILHVVRGQVRDAHAVDEPLHDLYVTDEGVLWGLSSGAAVRFEGGKDGFGKAKLFVLSREGAGRTWWYGIGGMDERVLVWGTGALLELQKKRFVPFEPEPEIGPDENVIALSSADGETKMLIASDGRGALAHCDGNEWRPIADEDVLDGVLVDFDSWRGVTAVLDRELGAFRIRAGSAPRRLPWPLEHEAFVGDDGRRRPFYALRITDEGTLVASDGGVVVIAENGPTFHTASGTNAPARLRRVGPGPRHDASSRSGTRPAAATGIAVTVGPHAWIWKNGAFHVLDVREW